MIIDHIVLPVSDIKKTTEFYLTVLAPIGVTLIHDFGAGQGLGANGKPELWLMQSDEAQKPMHIAFAAETRAQVDSFYQLALAAGATDNGAPGIRENYHDNYYGAFVIDNEGHNIEVVCHTEV